MEGDSDTKITFKILLKPNKNTKALYTPAATSLHFYSLHRKIIRALKLQLLRMFHTSQTRIDPTKSVRRSSRE
jgi:hypothetical protein